ncbi:putative NTN hydrolase domain protein [Caulobacter phage C1]|nr:putative NTN hydrolase domain protein [Caulobacter phage C1]UTU08574.1 putative NTN hydrolase domain protein [Caulobacter phage C2]UTU09090.1 putative NTN hydrolase domain protein [Caulobacter phage J4]UTU09648.1 putative NTN hydrolase domain protein [Caulobacter phage BL47]UTU10207.1 putative NTN hydrolase domain protein [Caulobacter phage RB23]WGN97241.1 putative NTN hydrolase domain protein [Bertelyvirus sp.]
MTCIVYRDGVLACDSWVLDIWTKIGQFPKIAKRETRDGAILFAASGNSGHCKTFLDWGRGDGFADWVSGQYEPPSLGEGDNTATGMVFMPDGSCVRFDAGLPPYALQGPFFAIGSGSWVALGALEAGATAEQAVEAAIKWDVGTNGPVRSLRHRD